MWSLECIGAVVMYVLCATAPGPVRGELSPRVRLVGNNDSQGELQFFELGGWQQVCSGSMDYVGAQLACQELGYSFFTAVGDVNEPAPAEAPFSFSVVRVDCVTKIQGNSTNLQRILECDIDFCLLSCDKTVHLSCDNRSSEDSALVAFTGTRTFWLIDPGASLLIQCSSTEFYCSGIHFVSRNIPAILFLELSSSGNCGSLTVQTQLGIDCPPGAGDVCLLTDTGDCGESGVVQYLIAEDQKITVCSTSFGFLEAYTTCSQLGLPKLRLLSYMPLDADSDNQSIALSVGCTGRLSVDCTGREEHFTECAFSIGNMTDNCTGSAHLHCDVSDPNEPRDVVLVGVSEDSSMPFAIISPDDDVFVSDCEASSAMHCPGVHYVNRSLPEVQDVLSTLSANGTCRDLGPINITILGINCTTPIHPSPTPIPSTTPMQENSISYAVELGVSLGIILVVFVIIVVVTVISLVKCRLRYEKQRKAIFNELQALHSSEHIRTSVQVTRPHRSIIVPKVGERSFEDLEIPFDCITLNKEIGSGAYGSIYHGVIACEHQMEPTEVAVKVLKKMATPSERRSLMLEIEMMKELGFHRHLVTMVACCTMGKQLALVMEYIPGGNLYDFLKKHRVSMKDEDEVAKSMDEEQSRSDKENEGKKHRVSVKDEDEVAKSMDEEQLRSDKENEGKTQAHDKNTSSSGTLSLVNQLQFARQITLGMECLASKNIVHRDLAARNILIDSDLILKLADFGLSRDMKDSDRYHMEGLKDRLPVRWMAVESIIDREFTVMSDVWAFGVVLWEIFTYAAFPFHHLTNKEVIQNVKEGERMSIPDNCPSEVYEIMLKCWKADPKDRPSIREVRAMLDNLLDTGGYLFLMEAD